MRTQKKCVCAFGVWPNTYDRMCETNTCASLPSQVTHKNNNFAVIYSVSGNKVYMGASPHAYRLDLLFGFCTIFRMKRLHRHTIHSCIPFIRWCYTHNNYANALDGVNFAPNRHEACGAVDSQFFFFSLLQTSKLIYQQKLLVI